MSPDSSTADGIPELATFFASIQHYSLQLEQANHALSESAAHFESLLHDSHHTPIPEHEHVTSKAETDELRAALTAGEHTLRDILIALHHDAGDAIATANTGREILAHSDVFGELASFASEADHSVATDSSQVQASLHSTEHTIQVFGDGLADLETRAQAWIEHCGLFLQDLTVQIRHSYAENLDGITNAGSLYLGQQTPQHLDQSHASLSSSLASLADWTSQASTQLASDVQHTMSEVGDATQSIFQTTVESAIDDLIRNELQHLIEDIGLQTASMAAGAEITAALSPYIPEIAVIKNGLHVINQLLDALKAAEDVLPWNWFNH